MLSIACIIEPNVSTWGVENSKSSAREEAARNDVLIAGPELLHLHLPGGSEVQPAAFTHTAVHFRIKLRQITKNIAFRGEKCKTNMWVAQYALSQSCYRARPPENPLTVLLQLTSKTTKKHTLWFIDRRNGAMSDLLPRITDHMLTLSHVAVWCNTNIEVNVQVLVLQDEKQIPLKTLRLFKSFCDDIQKWSKSF